MFTDKLPRRKGLREVFFGFICVCFKLIASWLQVQIHCFCLLFHNGAKPCVHFSLASQEVVQPGRRCWRDTGGEEAPFLVLV